MSRFNFALRSRNSTMAFFIFCLSGYIFSSTQAHGADLLWNGSYRVEGVYIKNYTLSSASGKEDSYIVHHLVMQPKITAADGLTIRSRFDAFNNALGNNTIGQVFGSYQASGSAPPSPAVMTRAESPETIVVNELYLTWANEFGALVVGRIPFNFGLGMFYNSGNGSFDHFLSNKDMVSYKLVLGNLTITPGYGKVQEGYLLNEDDINDYMVMAEYSNPDTDLSMGVMFDDRVAPLDVNGGNDFPLAYFSNLGTPGAYDGYSAYNLNFFVKKKWENFNLGVEVGFVNGYTGIKVLDTSGNYNQVNISGFGGAIEASYKTGEFTIGLHAGVATGDDQSTPTYEGYFFHPNYDVAMMMFNYPVGSYDTLGSSLAGSRPSTSGNAALNGLDTEVITNAIYVAPDVKWSIAEKFEILATFVYGQLEKPQPGQDSSLGFETDVGLNYHPLDKFTWVTSLGVLLPGGAYAGPNSGYPHDMAYGATSKAAISF